MEPKPKLSDAILRKLEELRPLVQSRAEKREAELRLQRARHSFKKSVSELEGHVGRIERAIVEGAQVCSPEEIELTRAALVKTARWLVEVASKIEDVMYGPMIGEEEEERRRA
jgi:hypothetical protein